MTSFDQFSADVERLSSFHCPLLDSVRAHSADVIARIDDPTPLADAGHAEDHPTRRHCAVAIVGRLFAIETRIRRIAWSYAFRPTVGELLREIREAIGRLEREHELSPTPYWTLDQVIAGGPGYERRWPGYSRG